VGCHSAALCILLQSGGSSLISSFGCENISKFYGEFRAAGPRSTPKEMALHSQLSEAVKATAIGTINAVVDFGDLIIERLSQQNYALALFAGFGGLTVVVIRSRRKLTLLQKKLDKLGHDVRQLELKESRRLMDALHLKSSSESQTQQLDAPATISPRETSSG
jgi:hypothetical protein